MAFHRPHKPENGKSNISRSLQSVCALPLPYRHTQHTNDKKKKIKPKYMYMLSEEKKQRRIAKERWTHTTDENNNTNFC